MSPHRSSGEDLPFPMTAFNRAQEHYFDFGRLEARDTAYDELMKSL